MNSHAVIGHGYDEMGRHRNAASYNWPEKKSLLCMKWLRKTGNTTRTTSTVTDFMRRISDSAVIMNYPAQTTRQEQRCS
ncbi:unnamed protein product [Onchocerca flexuosa]|uniref:Transposase n=1 Tax=Onchocerca flexuosa TaxID=387005 RepID=A0A183HTR8_9BILA|nr:unnamed protein product [Onchocerca flexuosa]